MLFYCGTPWAFHIIILVYSLQNYQFHCDLGPEMYCKMLFHMCNLRYFYCNNCQDNQMLYSLVKLDEVTSLLNILRQITFRLYSFCHEFW